MAPAVRTSRKTAEASGVPALVEASAPEPVVMVDDQATKLRAMMREFRDYLVKHSHDVGQGFAEEARKIHDGVVEKRAIRGEASQDEVRALLDDGIDVTPMPVFPDDRN